MTTVWNSIALEHMPHKDRALFCLLLYSQHLEQCPAPSMKERRREGRKRHQVSVLVELKI